MLLGLTLALVGLAADPTPVLAVLAALVVQVISVIAVVLLIKLLQLQAVPRRLPAGIGLAPYPEPCRYRSLRISACSRPGSLMRLPVRLAYGG